MTAHYNSIGCELTESGQSNLRRAIATILFIGSLCTSAASAETKPPADGGEIKNNNYKRVSVYAFRPTVPAWRFNGYGSWGGSGGWGATNGSGGYPDLPSLDPPEADPAPGDLICDNPVDIASGKKFDFSTDFSSLVDDGLELKRVYNQSWAGLGLLGYGWISNFDIKLSFNDPWGWIEDSCYPIPTGMRCAQVMSGVNIASLFAHRENGNVVRFDYDGNTSTWRGSTEDPLAYITRLANGNFKLNWPEGGYEIYRPDGFVIQRMRPDGVGLTYTYDNAPRLTRVTHTSGRYVQFVYGSTLPNSGAQLTQIIDPIGNIYTFKYPGAYGSSLNEVIYPDGKGNLLYHYEGGFSGISINGSRWTRYAYDTAGHVIESKKDNGADLTQYAYFTDRTERTNALGKKTSYKIQNGKVVEISGAASANCAATFSMKTVDSLGRIDTVTDNNGNIQDTDYDALGRVIKVTEALGSPIQRVTLYEWSPTTNQLLKETLIGVREISYTYTPDNRQQTISIKNITPGSPNLNEVHTTSFAYAKHPSGILQSKTIDGPLPGQGDALTYTYDSTGNLTSVANSLGHTTNYSNYNALGQPGRVVNANGAATDYQYDSRGRTTSVKQHLVEGGTPETSFIYGNNGLLNSVLMPDGTEEKYFYDPARRLIRKSQAEGTGTYAQVKYTYDALSSVTSVTKERANAP